ncbi:Imm10 family immunity protein [Saccharothrix australiensis]|uniref:Immunity protein 10 of polymorphic toxin system n=1 Tax=Saccharothrix australiensis TaxID=2072 RepID=A0A495W1A4_9PSEU|nr:Imm10 family immunity protein [Saccharothrix australiensis]RKT53658.1 immunity protein 10 of polymorphic toxin system [Saccharothrix australiensis]
MVEFTARSFGFEEDEDDEVLEVGVAESADGGGVVLLIQRATYDPDEQDVNLGLDSYCLVSDGRTHYGGVVRAARVGEELQLDMSSEAADTLDLDARVRIRLDGPEEQVEVFFRGLRTVLDWGRSADRPEMVGF